MYFKYSWNANATLAQVTSDLVSVICSVAPNSANLSAGCDKPFSTLLANTSVSNWVIHDALAGANSQVIKSLNLDGITYKYAQITVALTTISLTGWESWNAVTHVGTNQSSNVGGAASFSFGINTFTIAGNISLIATPRGLTIINSPLINNANIYLLEFSRDSVLLDNTYPCTVLGYQQSRFTRYVISDGSILSICRVKNPIAAGDSINTTIGNTALLNNILGIQNTSFNQYTGCLGIDGQYHLLTMPIQLGYSSISSTIIANLGTVLGGILLIPQNTFSYNNLDEIIINNITYILLKVNSNAETLLIPKA